jgi:hypothetical protein
MSGGRSSSSSSSSTSTSTDNSNTQISDNQGSVVNLEGFGNQTTIIETDNDAIEKAFAFGGNSLDSIDSAVNKAFIFGDEALDEALAFGGDALDKSLKQSFKFSREAIKDAQNTTENALDIAGNAQKNAFAKIRDIADSFTTSSSDTQKILIALAAVGAIVALIMFLRKRKG